MSSSPQEVPSGSAAALGADPQSAVRSSERAPWPVHRADPDFVPWPEQLRHPSVTLREWIALLLLLVLSDVTIYRGGGYAGFALFFALAPALFVLGTPRPKATAAAGVVGLLTLLLAARLLWLGGPLCVTAGVVLLTMFSLAIIGWMPYVLETAAHAFQTIVAGAKGMEDYLRALRGSRPPAPKASWLTVIMPLAALLGFGTIFILANPDLARTVGDGLKRFFEAIHARLADFLPKWSEPFFWVGVTWFATGLWRPWIRESAELLDFPESKEEEPAVSPLFGAYRNTLAVLIALFAVYLAFEFKTLWFRSFPKGFYYSGYAHEGAAWLTVALALATVVISIMFRGTMLRDPRLPLLRKLTWIWSALNLLLAAAVFHRMFIYIGFNGMTRMRTVGLLGISAVIAGFAMVIWKIVKRRDFWWLVRRDLWILAFAVYLYAVLPVDYLVHSYNVRRILAGDPAPSVQISVHPIDAGGLLAIEPLMNAEDAAIREGILAMLAEHAERDGQQTQAAAVWDWTRFQLAEERLRRDLADRREEWKAYTDIAKRGEALKRFHAYAYQWY